MQHSLEKNILRKTKSVCPLCLRDLDAVVVNKEGKIYLEKSCREHGDFAVMISEFPKDYKELNDSYFYFISDVLPQQEYYLCATTQCNIMCPVCFLRYCREKVDASTPTLMPKIDNLKNIKRFTFSHGEPTLCENLFGIIKKLRRLKKIVNMHTNGIKLADRQYASALKDAGINHVSVQFDGFEQGPYQDLRGSRLLEDKLRALNNLRELSIPVSLNVTIARGVNESQIDKIFSYALSQRFIKDVSFITYCHYEPDKTPPERYIVPDQLLRYIEEYTKGRISRKDVVLFQKLFFAYMRVFKKRKCFNYYHYLLIRTSKNYYPISMFIDLEKIARQLDRIRTRKKKLTHFTFFRIVLSSLRLRSLLFVFQGIAVFLRGGYPRRPTRFLTVTFATICDPYKYDSGIANNCGQGIIINDTLHDSYGTYLMEQMYKSRHDV